MLPSHEVRRRHGYIYPAPTPPAGPKSRHTLTKDAQSSHPAAGLVESQRRSLAIDVAPPRRALVHRECVARFAWTCRFWASLATSGALTLLVLCHNQPLSSANRG